MNRTVLITGSSSGIGVAAARFFAGKDWNVVATMRKPEAEKELNHLNNVLVTRLDVQDQDSIRRAIDAGIARFGKIDVLVNNAGYGQYGLFEATAREKIQEQFDVNVFGVMDVTRAILPHFRGNKSGMIINISSGGGLFTLPMVSLYNASKFALEGFSEALSYELASQNIVVKIVEPHGGVGDTQFSQRSNKDHADDAPLADYADFVARTKQAFARMGAAPRKSAAEVAEVIFEAATDGTDRLRYLVGNDSRGFIKARQTMSEGEYVAFMRGYFGKRA